MPGSYQVFFEMFLALITLFFTSRIKTPASAELMFCISAQSRHYLTSTSLIRALSFTILRSRSNMALHNWQSMDFLASCIHDSLQFSRVLLIIGRNSIVSLLFCFLLCVSSLTSCFLELFISSHFMLSH